MTEKRKRTTKHVLGDVYQRLDSYLSEHIEENLVVTSLEFSNSGAQGREPLFDASRCQKGTIMAYWKDENKDCIVISALEPGYEILAPKKMRYFFAGKYSRYFKIAHLDVTHLNVFNTTDFAGCFEKFGFGENNKETNASKIVGLETWDISNGKHFEEMFEWAFPQNENISLDLSSWRFNPKIRINFWRTFKGFAQQADKVILDVSNWNTTNVYFFDQMFENFAPHAKIVKVKGIEDWRLGTGSISLDHAFDNFAKASSCRLNLSKWSKNCTQKPTMVGFASGTFFQIKEPEWAD